MKSPTSWTVWISIEVVHVPITTSFSLKFNVYIWTLVFSLYTKQIGYVVKNFQILVTSPYGCYPYRLQDGELNVRYSPT